MHSCCSILPYGLKLCRHRTRPHLICNTGPGVYVHGKLLLGRDYLKYSPEDSMQAVGNIVNYVTELMTVRHKILETITSDMRPLKSQAALLMRSRARPYLCGSCPLLSEQDRYICITRLFQWRHDATTTEKTIDHITSTVITHNRKITFVHWILYVMKHIYPHLSRYLGRMTLPLSIGNLTYLTGLSSTTIKTPNKVISPLLRFHKLAGALWGRWRHEGFFFFRL